MANKPEERRKIESSLENKPRVVETSSTKRFFGSFLASDLEDVRDHIIFDVIQPRAKTLLVDALHRACEMIILGKASPNRSAQYSREGYTRYYRENRVDERPRDRNQNTMYAPYRDPLFDFEDDAWKVIDDLIDYVEEYPTLSISEFLTFCKRPEDDEYTYQNYGWTRAAVKSARPEEVNGGWIIKLPKPKYIRGFS